MPFVCLLSRLALSCRFLCSIRPRLTQRFTATVLPGGPFITRRQSQSMLFTERLRAAALGKLRAERCTSAIATLLARVHRYSYGWRSTTVAGATVVGGGYSPTYTYSGGVGYGYPHHSCHWYYNYEPNNVPSWCGTYANGGSSYAVSYGSTGGYGGYGYRRHYTWGTSRESASIRRVGVTSRVQVASRAHVDSGARHVVGVRGKAAATHFAGAGGHVRVH